jgi:hypothetical protein
VAISSVVTEGYGPGASIALVVTSGYGLGEAVVVEPAQPQPNVSAGIGSLHPRKTQRTAAPPRRRFYDYDTDEDAPKRKVAVHAPPKLRVVHETVEIAAADPVHIIGPDHVEVTEHERNRVRSRVEARIATRRVFVTGHEPVLVTGTVLVECITRDATIVDRNAWQTVRYDNEALSQEIAAARVEKDKLVAELGKARRDREALELLLLAA